VSSLLQLDFLTLLQPGSRIRLPAKIDQQAFSMRTTGKVTPSSSGTIIVSTSR
jgi:hypothetical protein